MASITNQDSRRRFNSTRMWLPAFLFSLCFLFFTPTIPRSHHHHQFVDMRNLLGVPNTINVITNFPFLVVGVLGFVLVLDGALFNISSHGEVYAWLLFYAGIVGVAFGSAYYHLKPDNHRVLWDTLPMMVAFSSLFSTLVVERFSQRIGIYLLAKFEGATDKKLYHANNYIISGHSLEHLCLSLIPIVLSIMLIYRETKFQS
ncbi:hypothetical protein PIB30_043104 [Stylosanthes scabra]|uniref:Uncharacterized protein n=1 Tax=Stylosanthes scabra TaxID=79078 RepID=A0ABU6UHI9_9FABA|nr:hypothetical protein [Stylosanthes scabra]